MTIYPTARLYDLKLPYNKLAELYGVTEDDILKANCIVANMADMALSGSELDNAFNLELNKLREKTSLHCDPFTRWKQALSNNPKMAVQLQHQLIGGSL